MRVFPTPFHLTPNIDEQPTFLNDALNIQRSTLRYRPAIDLTYPGTRCHVLAIKVIQ